jgi:ribulose-5-phosphate 4-epimerase/fuculose-1-phosphate aldolase
VIEVLKQVVAAAYASLGEVGIVLGAEGNASVADRSSGIALVTGTGLHAREATPDGIAEVGLADGAHRSGPAPTSELPSHLALLRAGHGAVIHTHAPHATAVGLVLDEVPLVMAEQAARAGGAVPVLPYVTPGSEDMALSLQAALRGPVRAVVLRNHGLFTVGPDVISALAATVATEEAARVYLLARGIGEPATVPGHAVATLRGLGGITA